MIIETLRLFDNTHEEGVTPENQTGCEGLAIRIDGARKFRYFNCKRAPEDSNLDRDHADVTKLDGILIDVFRQGAISGDPDSIELIEYEPTYDVDEFAQWADS